jgi:hypothetical protein
MEQAHIIPGNKIHPTLVLESGAGSNTDMFQDFMKKKWGYTL